MKLTVRKIAKECNVSVATVSRALNDLDNVREETKRTIYNSLIKYDINTIANIPLLKKFKTKSIGLVVGEIGDPIEQPFYQRAVAAYRLAIKENGGTSIMHSEVEFQEVMAKFNAGQRKDLACDGIIFFHPLRDWERQVRALVKRGIHCWLIGRQTDIKGVGVVFDDDYKGAWSAMEHLHSRGYATIGMFGRNLEKDSIAGRVKAYREFIAAHSLCANPNLLVNCIDNRIEEGAEKLLRLMVPPVSLRAVLCEDDFVAASLYKILYRKSIRIPDQLAIVGYNNDFTAEMLCPGLTSVKMQIEEMVSIAYRMLADQLRGGTLMAGTRIEVPNFLVIRESSGPEIPAVKTSA